VSRALGTVAVVAAVGHGASPLETEMDEEVRFHLEARARRLMQEGSTPAKPCEGRASNSAGSPRTSTV